MFGVPARVNPAGGLLAQAFILPPFTVLNAREGWWQERKRAWLALGIRSELGRGGDLTAMGGAIERREAIGRGGGMMSSPGGSPRPAMDYSNRQRGDGKGRPI